MKKIYFIIALLTIANSIEVKAGWYELLFSLGKTSTETHDSISVTANDTDKLASDYLSTLKQAADSANKNSEIAYTVKHAAKVAFVTWALQSGCASKNEKSHMLLSLQKEEMARDKEDAEHEFDSSCFKNMDAPRTEHGVPVPCQKQARKLALYAGTEIVDQKMEKFNQYTPTPTQIAEYELDTCLLRNMDAPRTENGVPLPCQKEACKLAFQAGAEIVDKKIKDFNKYTPAPTQTVAEYEAKSQEKPISKGWLW